MSQNVSSNSDKLEVIELPMYPVYTDQFDKECSAKTLYDEPRGNVVRKHSIINFSQAAREKLLFMLKNYKKESLELYGYVPPLIFITDNSGSLRGNPATYLESLLRVISHTLEEVGIPFEVLGYTTRTWKGGESRKKWLNEGRKRSPGRLCDIQHTVFKGFGEKFADVGEFYALLAKEGYLKENLDGEALIWAYRRLKSHTDKKGHIIHLSDGAPVDDSTLSVNPASFLQDHLREVLIALQSDSNVKVHLGYIYESFMKNSLENPYDSHMLLNPSHNNLDDFTDQIFPSLMQIGMKEIIEKRKKELGEILGEEASLIGEEDLLFITRNFDPEILKILKEFGYSGIDILLHINTPIEDIDERIFRMNLGIIKHSGKDFGEELGKLLPILVHYPYHEHLELILNSSDSIDSIILTLGNSDKFIQATQGKVWQKSFFEKYKVLIEQDRLNIEILLFLIEGNHISEEDIGDLYIILQFGNYKTVKVLLGDLAIPYSSIKKEKDVFEYTDSEKLRHNFTLLEKVGTEEISHSQTIHFCMSVNSLMLQAAIQYGVTTYKSLKKLQSILEKTYTAESEQELIQAIIYKKERSDFSKNMITRAPFMTLMGTIGFSNLTYSEGLMVFIESFNNIGWGDLAAFWFFYLSGKGGIQRFKAIKTNTQSKTSNSVKLKSEYKRFKSAMDTIIASKYSNITTTSISELESSYRLISQIDDQDAQKMIGVDTEKIKLQYNVVMLLYYLKLFPDIRFLKDDRIATLLTNYINVVLDFGPRYVQDSGYNYKFFLEQKSKLQGTFGADFGESEKKKETSALTPEIRSAYKTLGVKSSATQEEVTQAYRKLVKEYHPDKQGGDGAKMREVNTAKDIIDKYRGWN